MWGPTRVEPRVARPGSVVDDDERPPRRLDVVAKHPREAAADVPGLVVARANVTFETTHARARPPFSRVRASNRPFA